MKSNHLLPTIVGIILALLGSVLGTFSVSHAQSSQDWLTPVNLSSSGSATDPILVADLNGTIHAIWVDNLDRAYKYSQSKDGKTWTTPQAVVFPFSVQDPPPMFLSDAYGTIHIFWITSDKRLLYGQTNPVDLSNPGNWQDPTSLARGVLSFDVTLDSRNVLNVAYLVSTLSDGTAAGTYYRQSIIGGGRWLSPVLLYASEYFKSTKAENAYIRISTAKLQGDERIYVTWDNRPQKRVFMALSEDTGQTWQPARQIKGPEDTGGIGSPFNLTVAALDNHVLLIWQVGEPGSSMCTVYSQWSEDGGKSWGATTAVLGGSSECPVSLKIVDRSEGFISLLLIGEVSSSVVAWDGEGWSDVQNQIQLPSFSNPLTFDAVLLSCRFDLFYKSNLYVAGCDLGEGGDVWFLSRTLEPVKDWFSPSSVWGVANVLPVKSEKPMRISHFSSAADGTGDIHVMWSETSVGNSGSSDSAIEYARWDGKEWTIPQVIYKFSAGTPVQLSLTADSLERLLVSWIDNYNGDLVFGWANIEKANIPSEWADITGVPAPSHLIASPDGVVDGSGRIVTVYAVPVNEGRGIYLVESTDGGRNWSTPSQVFDATSADWERIDRPRLALGTDGVLHLIFARQTLRVGQTVGLYYSRSTDGGSTWSDPQIVSEGETRWADIVSYGDKTVHIAWQEYDGLVFANMSQVSIDGGETWGKQNDVTGVSDASTDAVLASDGKGMLHFIQLQKKDDIFTADQENFVLQDWRWDGNDWTPELTKDVVITGRDVTHSLSANITSTGFLTVFIPLVYTDAKEETVSEVLMFSRHLGESGNGQMIQVPALPTAVNEEIVSEVVVQPTPTPDLSILYDDNKTWSSSQRTIVGLIMLGASLVVTTILIIWRRPSNK